MINEEVLVSLRKEVSLLLSERRFRHTLAVEKAARFLAQCCLPDKVAEISVAAILHDVTKELSAEEQERIVKENNLAIDINDVSFPLVAHSYTASVFVRERFPHVLTDEIESAISSHTLGNENMSVFDKIIFLADFIEETRTHSDCIVTAEFVYNSMRIGRVEENISVLNTACIMEIDSTIISLKKRNIPVNRMTLLARGSLISKT